MSTTKKLILIIVVLVLVIVALYFIFRSKPAPEEPGVLFLPEAEAVLGGRAPIKSQEQIEKEKLELETLRPGEAFVETPFDASSGELPQESLAKLLPDATVGATIIASTTPVIRYIRADNGHVWDVRIDGSLTQRISNVTIPFIYKTRWSADGQRAVVAFEDQNQTRIYSMDLTKDEPTGAFLNPALVDFVFSPAQDIIQLIPSGENLNIVRSSPNGSGGRTLLALPHKDFQATWPAPSIISLITKAAATVEGFAYLYNTNGGFEKILGSVRGLTASWSSDGQRFVYSSTNERDGSINLFTATRLTPSATRLLSVRTFTEKCAWSKKDAAVLYCAVPRLIPSAQYPDAWWQGLVSFQDDVVKIDTTTGKTMKLLNTISDAIDLTIAQDDEFLLFRDKKDGSLWSVKLQ